MNEIIENNENIELNDAINEDRIWKVYLHTVPKEISGYDWDKYYVGITKMKPTHRWGRNGNGYKTQVFYRAIEKYGWDNIKHEVLFIGLTQEEANKKEMELIEKLDSRNSKHGYNITFGGDSRKHMSKPLAQYDLNGDFLKLFCGLYEAEKIYGDINMFSQMSKGFMWRYIKDVNNFPHKINAYKNPFISEPLEQYDLHGNYIKTFSSHNEALKTYPHLQIERKDRSFSTSYGYQWKYQNSDLEIKDITKISNLISKVYIYNLDGTYYGEFKSKRDAVKELYPQDITRSVPNYIFDNIYNNEYLGYRWTRDYYEKLPELIKINKGIKPVIQIDPITNKIIDIYNSAVNAETYFYNTSKKPHSINESCRVHNSKAHGFIWYYFEDFKLEESSIDDSFLLEKYNIYKLILDDLYKGGK